MRRKNTKTSARPRPAQSGISFKNLERTLNADPEAQISFLKDPVGTLRKAGVMLDVEERESMKSQISSMRQLLKMLRSS